MSKAALQDAQWLQSLPQTLEFDHYFWEQPDEAKAWFNADETFPSVNDNAYVLNR